MGAPSHLTKREPHVRNVRFVFCLFSLSLPLREQAGGTHNTALTARAVSSVRTSPARGMPLFAPLSQQERRALREAPAATIPQQLAALLQLHHTRVIVSRLHPARPPSAARRVNYPSDAARSLPC